MPYWKTVHMALPKNILVLHNCDFTQDYLKQYPDEVYLRIKHDLKDSHSPNLPDGFQLCNVADYAMHINRCYTDISMTESEMRSYSDHPTYSPELWIAVKNDKAGEIAATGTADAQILYELAMKHIYGDGVPEDNDRALELLTKAHDMGHLEATYNLGICYHYGFGTEVNLEKAYTLYLESAEAGYGKGMELVGRFYNQGIYVEKNREKAEYWLRKAIQTGEADVITEAEKELAVKM